MNSNFNFIPSSLRIVFLYICSYSNLALISIFGVTQRLEISLLKRLHVNRFGFNLDFCRRKFLYTQQPQLRWRSKHPLILYQKFSNSENEKLRVYVTTICIEIAKLVRKFRCHKAHKRRYTSNLFGFFAYNFGNYVENQLLFEFFFWPLEFCFFLSIFVVFSPLVSNSTLHKTRTIFVAEKRDTVQKRKLQVITFAFWEYFWGEKHEGEWGKASNFLYACVLSAKSIQFRIRNHKSLGKSGLWSLSLTPLRGTINRWIKKFLIYKFSNSSMPLYSPNYGLTQETRE